MIAYVTSLILNNFKSRIQDEEELKIYTCQAVHYFYIYYLEDDNFIITDSFSGMVFHKIRQAINEKSNHAVAEYSINFMLEDGNEIDYEDNTKGVTEEIEQYDAKLNILKHIIKFINEFEVLCNNKRENFLRLQAIYHYLTYGEKKADNLFKNYGRFGKIKYEQTLEYLHKELLNLHKESI
jgi:hypothetical protein